MISLSDVVIETTRRCNLRCEHCLRGDAEALDMDINYLRQLFEQVDSIGSITFSGGEPSLPQGVEVIEKTLELAKQYDVYVGSFYIATNGTAISERFVIACLRWYAYCEDPEMCGVQVSNDLWHSEQEGYDTTLLDGLSFFSRKHKDEGAEYTLIDSGLATENGIGERENIPCPIEDEITEDWCGATLYLNCYGEIIIDCDLAYSDQGAHKLCDVSLLKQVIDKISSEKE